MFTVDNGSSISEGANRPIATAAIVRNRIMELFTKIPDGGIAQRLTSVDIREKPCIKTLDIPDYKIDEVLRNLHKKHELAREPNFDPAFPQVRFIYMLPIKTAQAMTRKATMLPAEVNAKQKVVKIDVSKTNGRILLNFEGISIDIGIIN